jgi:tetraprenyl-beta-curcumene synthase
VSYARNRRVADASAFASAARSYWLDVFPVVRREFRRLHAEARRIPDPTLRYIALDALGVKWSGLEGAAAFAAFVAPSLRPAVARLLVGYQAAFDYADTLMEQPSDVPAANARQLHAALVASLEPGRQQPDYYRYHARRNDGGYLERLVDGCHAVVAELPAYPPLAATVTESAQRAIEYQCRISLSTEMDHPALSRWAALATPHHHRLRWWETWASCGSSLATLALLAAAADPTTNGCRAEAIETLYWPWAGALHTLLDCLIDRADDATNNRPNLLDLYASPQEIAERMGFLTAESVRLAAAAGIDHSLILAGMASLYVSDRQAWMPEARPATESILDALGELAMPTMLVLRGRRLAQGRLVKSQAHSSEISSSGYPLNGYPVRDFT